MSQVAKELVNTGSRHAPEALSSKQVLLRYGVAAACMLVAFGVRYFLTPVLGEELPFLFFISAALVAAWYGGAVAGMVALLIGLFLADWFFIGKIAQGQSARIETFRVIRYMFTASLGIVLIEVLHRNRRRLEREIAKREASEADLLRAHMELRQHARELDLRVSERTAQLTATVEALQNLLYHIAHNFRAPLRAVRGYTEILAEEYARALDARARECCARMSAATERMDALIHDLLDYGRLGHIEIELMRVDLEKLVEDVLNAVAPQIRDRQAELEVAHPLPEVRANAEILEEVVTNLIENAIKFVPRGTTPRIQVRPEKRDTMVRLWVEDNGIGIDPRYHARIFGPFETLHSADTFEGTGIGLAIVKEGIARMGGRVGVESEPGEGSRFWIELPA